MQIPEYDSFDASFFDEEDDVFGLEEKGATAGANASVDPATLAFALLLLSTYTTPPPWNGTASAGTSLGHNCTSAKVDPPSGKALSCFQRSNLSATDPWNGTASTGGSGSVSWANPGGLSPPSAGPALNGYATRYFNTSFGQFQDASVALDTLVSNSASSGWMLIQINSFQFDSTNPAANDPLLYDSGQYYGLTLSKTARTGGNAVTFWIATGGNIVGVDYTVLATPGSWQIVQWRHTGTTLEIRVLGLGPPGPVPWTVITAEAGHSVGNIDAGFIGQTLHAGTDFSNTQFGDYAWADGGIANTALSYAVMDSLALDVQNFYALSSFYFFGGPATGASLNGHTSADFGGATNRIALQYCDGPNTSPKYLSDLLGGSDAQGFYIGMMVKARTAVADLGNGVRYSNATLFGDLSSNLYVTFSDAGVSAGIYDTTTGFDDVTLACSTGSWHFIQVWHDGITLWLQIDNGAPKCTLSANPGLNAPLTWFRTYVTAMTAIIGGGGANGGIGAVFFDGEMHFVDTMAGAYPNAYQRYGNGLYLQTRYGVSFGFVGNVSYTRNITETVTAPTDGKTRTAAYVRAPADAVTKPTDGVLRTIHFTRGVVESVAAPTDVDLRTAGFTRTVSEAIAAASDALARQAAYARAPADAVVKPTDNVARAATYVRGVGDAVTAPTDAVTETKGTSRAVAESVSAPTDGVLRIVAFARGPSENVVAPTDSPSRSATYARGPTETVTAPTDSAARAAAFVRAITESVTKPTDAVARILAAIRAIGESVSAPTDTPSRSATYVRGITDSVSAPTDTIAFNHGFLRAVSETVAACTDVVARVVAYVRGAAESVSAPTDSPSRGFVTIRAIPENVVKVTDGLTRVVAYSRSIGESFSAPTDAPSRSDTYVRGVPESVAAPTDTAARTIAYARGVGENVVKPTDAVARSEGFLRAISESLAAMLDAVSRSATYVRGVGDSVTAPTDSVSFVKNGGGASYTKNITETVAAPTDAALRTAAFARAVPEAVTKPTDAALRADTMTRAVGETVSAPTDLPTRSEGLTRGITESVTKPTDSAARQAAFARAVAESVTKPTDAVTHLLTVARAILESAPAPSDSLARAVAEQRFVAENLPALSDFVSRTVAFFRAVGESVTRPTDTISFVHGQNATRNVGETVQATSDGLFRVAVYFRSLSEQVAAPLDVVSWTRGHVLPGRFLTEFVRPVILFRTRVSEEVRWRLDVQDVVRFRTRVLPEDPLVGLKVGARAEINTSLDAGGEFEDPNTLAIDVTDPAGVETTYVLGVDAELSQVLDSDNVLVVGHYRARIPCTLAGKWKYVWRSTGAVAPGVDSGDYDVEAV